MCQFDKKSQKVQPEVVLTEICNRNENLSQTHLSTLRLLKLPGKRNSLWFQSALPSSCHKKINYRYLQFPQKSETRRPCENHDFESETLSCTNRSLQQQYQTSESNKGEAVATWGNTYITLHMYLKGKTMLERSRSEERSTWGSTYPSLQFYSTGKYVLDTVIHI